MPSQEHSPISAPRASPSGWTASLEEGGEVCGAIKAVTQKGCGFPNVSFESLRDLGSVSPWLPPLGLARRRTGWPKAWGEAAARTCRCSGKVRNLPQSGQRRCSHPRAVSNPRPRRRGSGAALGQAVGAAVGTPPTRPHLLHVTSTAAKSVSLATLEKQ